MTQLRHLTILFALFVTLPAAAEESPPESDAPAQSSEGGVVGGTVGDAEETPTDSAFVDGEAQDLSKLKEYYNSIKRGMAE